MKTITPLAWEGLVRGVIALCAVLLVSGAARAHTLPISELTLVADEAYLHLDLRLHPFELTFFPELDANRNGALELREWQGQGEKIAWRILENLRLSVDGRRVTADIAGLSQSYESHHIAVRAHFPADTRGAKVCVESRLAELAGGSHVTQVSFGTGERMQTALLDARSNQVTFEPPGDGRVLTSVASVVDANDFTALQANERAVMALLSLLLLAALPPAGFFVLSTRFGDHTQLPQGALH